MMKSIFFLILAISLASCDSNKTEITNDVDQDIISFVGNFQDTTAEVVIKKMVRKSLLDQEYTILKHGDTLVFDVIGTSYFKFGFRNTVFQSVILDKGDLAVIGTYSDSASIFTEITNVKANMDMFNGFHNTVEDSFQSALSDIINTKNMENLKIPYVVWNDFEKEELLYTHLYRIDRELYKNDRKVIDRKLQNALIDLEASIDNDSLDIGLKQMFKQELYNCFIDKNQRLGSSSLQKWAYEKIMSEIEIECDSLYTLDWIEDFVDFSCGKTKQKIHFLDLEKAYKKTDDIQCPTIKQEAKRVCLNNMVLSGNKLQQTKEYLDSYVEHYRDSIFLKYIDDKYEIQAATMNGRAVKSVLVDIHDNEYDYHDIIQQLKGNVILIDIWGSWCAPCRKSMPKVKQLAEKYKDKNFRVIYISIDKYPSPWKKSMKEEGIYADNSYWMTNHVSSVLKTKFKLKGIPRYILYDKNGEVAYHNAPKPEAIEDIIVSLIDI